MTQHALHFALVAAVCVSAVACADSNGARLFETAQVRRGDLVATVSATGTLSAVGTVTVGTQVSGTVARVVADFNDRVAAGDLLAVIDTETLDAAVRDAEAGVTRAQASLTQAESEVLRATSQQRQAEAQGVEAQASLRRFGDLLEQGLIAAQDFDPKETAAVTATVALTTAHAQVASSHAGVTGARASVASAEASLAQVRKNRRNAEIRAPISGVVIQRNVDAGQTVAASFSTPILFVIAEDLAKTEIHAQVDESDIGLIQPGQAVDFSVAAYPDRTFHGTVRQRRLQPETIQNVVHYTVVVTAHNEDGLLLPGMTATVDFVIERIDGALLVPAATLRFQPPDAVRSGARDEQRKAVTAPESAGGDTPAFAIDAAELWIPDGERSIKPLVVRVLGTDGAFTAIAPMDNSSARIEPGFEVVTRMTERGGNPLR